MFYNFFKLSMGDEGFLEWKDLTCGKKYSLIPSHAGWDSKRGISLLTFLVIVLYHANSDPLD